MLTVFNFRDTAVWLLLIIATLSTWYIGDQTLHSPAITFSSRALMIAIAAIKVRLIIREFMQVRKMPLPWKLAFDGWLLAVSSALLVGLSLT